MSAPNHVQFAAIKYAVEGTPGTRNASTVILPQSGVDLRYEPGAREYDEGFGPGSDMLAAQELVAQSYSLDLGFNVYSGAFLRDACNRTSGVMPSVTFDIATSSDAAESIYGAKCSSLRLSSAERSVLKADTSWVAMHTAAISAFSWTPPQIPPYVWAKGTWSLGGQVIGIDLTFDQNLEAKQAMSSTLPAAAYDPTHIIVGNYKVSANIRAITKYDISTTDDTINANLVFVSGTTTLTIALTQGTYRGRPTTVPRDALVEYGIPMVFRNCTINEA